MVEKIDRSVIHIKTLQFKPAKDFLFSGIRIKKRITISMAVDRRNMKTNGEIEWLEL